MSESINIIVKLISSLASPWACLKYILVALILVVSWKIIWPLSIIDEISGEHKKIIILLVSVALGAALGDFIYFVFNKIKDRVIATRLNEELRCKFRKAYNHIDDKQIILLEILLNDNHPVDITIPENTILLENKYLKEIQKINFNTVLVEINPIVKDIVIEKKNEMTEWQVEDFFCEQDKINAQKTLRYLEVGSGENFEKVERGYLDSISKSPICIDASYSPENDHYHVWFIRQRFKKYFENNTGKEYKNEATIEACNLI